MHAGSVLSMSYDVLGRLKQRSATQGSSTLSSHSWSYDSRSNGRGLPASETANGTVNSISKAYYYDSHSRPNRQVTTIDGTAYETLTEYDVNYGRVKAQQYPGSNIKVGTVYDAYGYQTQLTNAATGFVYQTVDSRDAWLNVLTGKKNHNSLLETRNYSEVTGQMKSIKLETQSGASQRHYLAYGYKAFGNLDWQEQYYDNGAKSSRETYDYDKLHRLTSSQRTINGATQTPLTYDYDAVGNLTHKDDYASNYQYGSSKPNAVSSVTKLDGTVINYSYDASGNLINGDGKTLTYNAYNKPVTIEKGNIESTFSYGADLMRFKQVKTGLTGGTQTTIYLDKLTEIVTQGSVTKTKSYIGDVAIITKEETVGSTLPNHSIRYTHRDRLGSVVTLTDHNNAITEVRSYDPFGKPREGDFTDAAAPTLTAVVGGNPYTNRGFTDHEHLDDAQLIHMNGRAYDYNLGRFLSVDPFIQEPGNSQSMNPYSYIMNNPLAGTDPSGYKACAESEGKPRCDAIIYPNGIPDSTGGAEKNNGNFGNVGASNEPKQNGHKNNKQGTHTNNNNTSIENIGDQSTLEGIGFIFSAMYEGAKDFFTEDPVGETIIDFTPILGDGKGIKEAIDDPTWVNILAAGVGIFPYVGDLASKGLKGGDEVVDLYRAVGPEELESIRATEQFTNLPGLESKYFTTSAEDAADYAKQAVRAFGDEPYTIIKTQVNKKVLNQPNINATVDGGIPAVVLPNKDLKNLKPKELNYSPLPKK